MRTQVGLRVADRLPPQRRIADRRGTGALELDRHRQSRHPDVGAALEPFVVAQPAVAVLAPALAPGVLQPEAAAVVADDGVGMPADRRLLRPADAAARGGRVPAFVHGRRGVEHAGLGEGGVHRHQVLVVDAGVGTQRIAQGVAGALVGVGLEREARDIGPQRFGADAVAVPGLHRAAAAGAGVALAFPFVVAARHVVEHARADRGGVGLRAPPAQQGVGDGGQAEGGAGAVAALVEHRHALCEEVFERRLGRHVDQGRLEHAVAEVGGVGPRVEDAADAGVEAGDRRRCSGYGHGHATPLPVTRIPPSL